MKTIVPAVLAGLCLASAAGAAEEPATIPVDRDAPAPMSRAELVPYRYVGIGVIKTDYENTDIDQQGFVLDGSYMVVPNVFVTGAYYAGETDDLPGLGPVEVSQLNLGVGYRHMLGMSASLFATVELVEAELECCGESESDSGYEIDIGLRGLLAERVEGKGEIQYLDVFDDSETYLNLQALYQVVPHWQVGIDLLDGGQQTSYGLIGRFSF